MRNTTGLARVTAFCSAVPGRYLPLSDAALRLGCRLWAQARHAGTPTAAPSELGCDVLLAAQALTREIPEADRVIATTNVGHLAQFVAAQLWTQMTPCIGRLAARACGPRYAPSSVSLRFVSPKRPF